MVTGLSAHSKSMKKRLSVVHCIDNMGIGGTELNAVRTVELLRQLPIELRVLALNPEGPLRPRYARAGVEVVSWPVGSLYSAETLTQIIRLARRFRVWNIDIVHAHDKYTGFVCSLAARLAGVARVIASKRWTETSRRHRLTSAIAFRAAHTTVANSLSVADSLVHVDGISPKKVVLLPNFVDDIAFEHPGDEWRHQILRELGIPHDGHVVAIVASLSPVKRHEVLLRAFPTVLEQVPNTWLVVVGEGVLRPGLERLARELGIRDHVKFCGNRPQHPSLHHIADVSALVSSSEGFPNSLVEAMAAARPLLGTDVPGIRDAVRDGVNGRLVPSEDTTSMAKVLSEMLQDRATRLEYGARGLREARDVFSATRGLRNLIDLYGVDSNNG